MPAPDISVTNRAEPLPDQGAEVLRAFIDQAPVVMAMFDRQLRYIGASQRWVEKLCGGTADVVGRSHYEVNPEVPLHWRDLHRRALAGEKFDNERERLQRPDGSPMWVHWQVAPWRDATGEIGGITIVGEDVTAAAETEETLRQETRVLTKLHDVGWRLRIAGSLREGLEEMLWATIELLGGDMGHVHILETNATTLHLAAQHGFAPGVLEQLQAVAATDDTPAGHALRVRMPLVIADTELDEAYAAYRSLARDAGYRAVVKAPLIGRFGTPLGMISTHFRAPHQPSADDLQRLELYRRRAADFVERFNVDEALRQSSARLAQFYDVGLRLWEERSLQGGLDATLAGIIDLVGADMGAIQLLDRRNVLHLVTHRGLTQEFIDYFREAPAEQDTSVGRALRSGEIVVVEDTELDPATHLRWIRNAADYRAFVAVPLVSSHGISLGMLSAHFRVPHRPSGSEMKWLELYRRRAADFIQRLRGQDAAREGAERLRRAMAAGHMGMFDWDIRTGVFSWSDEWYRMLGYKVGEVEPTLTAWEDRIHPDDRERARFSLASTVPLPQEFVSEYRIVRPDGETRWIRTLGRFSFEGGKPIRLIGLKQDITEARQQVETQRVLVAELQHRTRNLMAVVQSIAHQTLDNVESLADFEDRFNDRLEALSRVQSLLSRADDEPITLDVLVTMELEVLGSEAFSNRITVEGPEVPLRKSAVEMLTLAFHELLTNAIKYGALASPRGRLLVVWRVVGVRPNQRLVVEWTERGSEDSLRPDPARRGYGRTLIEEALPYSLAAETTFELGADGLRCRISLPITPYDAKEAF